VKRAQGEEALNRHCAKKCRGRDVRVEVRRAPWRRRIRAGVSEKDFPGPRNSGSGDSGYGFVDLGGQF